ncbi:phage integrase [Shigella boydii]|nr:phage integrase [Shigella boydii]
MELLSTQHISLLDRIKGNSVTLFCELILNFRNEIERRQLSTNTMKRHNQRLKIISEYFGGVPVKNIGIREVYSFLEIRAAGSKFAIANQYRALLSVKWHTEFGHLNRGDMLTSEQHRCSNEKKKF